MNLTQKLTIKKALIDLGVPAYRVFQEIGINPSRGSQIVCGIVDPSSTEKKKIAEKLKRNEHEIFPPQVQA